MKFIVLYSLLYLFFVIAWARAQVLEPVTRIPGSSDISNVHFSQDGNYLLASDFDTIRVWDAMSGKQAGASIVLSSISGYATFLPGDSTILTIAYASDTVFKVWNWRTGDLLRSVNLYRPVHAAAMTGEGQYLVILVDFPKRQYEIWDIVTGTYQRVLTDNAEYRNLQIGTKEEYGVVQGDTSYYRINLKDGVISGFNSEMPDFFDAYLSQDGKRIGYSRILNKPTVFDVETLDSLFDLDIDIDDYTTVTMGFSPDHRWISTITRRRASASLLDIWDGVTGRHVMQVAADTNLRLGITQIAPHNDYVLVHHIPSGMLLMPVNLPIVSVPAVVGISSRDLIAYPNPSGKNVNIQWYQASAGWIRFRVFNLQGEPVYLSEMHYYQPGQYYEYLSVSGFPSGIYYCEISLDGRRSITSFAVQH